MIEERLGGDNADSTFILSFAMLANIALDMRNPESVTERAGVTLPLIMRIVPVRAAAAVNYENIGKNILGFAANLRIWIWLPAAVEAELQWI